MIHGEISSLYLLMQCQGDVWLGVSYEEQRTENREQRADGG